MAHWTLDDIPWDQFDASKIDPTLVPIIKSASLVEYNAGDYARYLREVFAGDADFAPAIEEWAQEEVQHGAALARWAEMADPTFNFKDSFRKFTDGYKLPQNVNASVRGSRAGELIARCVVETGTSSYYTAIKDHTDEPVLKLICAKIAADEHRHYKLFYTHLKNYLAVENINFYRRFKVALGRIVESEDDELAFAYFSANDNGTQAYDRKTCARLYSAAAFRYYRKDHVERMTGMVFKAIGLKPSNMVNRAINNVAWRALKYKAAA